MYPMFRAVRRLAAVVAAFAALAGGAAPGWARPAVAAQAHAHTRPALWKVSANGATVWLFGTIHALPKGVGWYRGPVEHAFDGSDELVTEIIEGTPQSMQALVMAKAMLPAGQTLTALLPARLRPAYARALAANGLAADALDRFQPWYAAVALSTLPLLKTGYDPANGVDAVLAAKAVPPRGHEALETPEEQLSLFAALSQPVQIAFLRQVVKGLPTLKAELTGMVAAWRTGRADRLAAIMNADQDSPEMRERLLIDRNRKWAAWLADRLAHPHKPGETLFVAVGAGHLAGPGSVQAQLAKAGLRAVRVQ